MKQTEDLRTVVVTGATGFIGQAVTSRLQAQGWRVIVVSRDPARARRVLPAATAWIDYAGEALEDAVTVHGRVIRLAGQNPLERRWTSGYKAQMWDSRVGTAERMAKALAGSRASDRVLVSAGGINIHASGGDAIVSETSALGEEWVARMLHAKEAAADRARGAGVRVVQMRIGLAIGRGGGPLPFIERPFRMRMGGHVGSGRQFVPWLHIDDMAAMFVEALERRTWDGPIIAAAPNPARAADLARAVGRRVGRASWCHMAAPMARLLLGEVATLVLSSYRASPARALSLGFEFRHPEMDGALDEIYRGERSPNRSPGPARAPAIDSRSGSREHLT